MLPVPLPLPCVVVTLGAGGAVLVGREPPCDGAAVGPLEPAEPPVVPEPCRSRAQYDLTLRSEPAAAINRAFCGPLIVAVQASPLLFTSLHRVPSDASSAADEEASGVGAGLAAPPNPDDDEPSGFDPLPDVAEGTAEADSRLPGVLSGEGPGTPIPPST